MSQLVWETGSWTTLGSLVGRVKSKGGWLWGCGSPRTGFHLLVGRAIAQGLWFWGSVGLGAGLGLLVQVSGPLLYGIVSWKTGVIRGVYSTCILTHGAILMLSACPQASKDCCLLAGPAAAKSLQSCPILCDPIERSPPGSPVPEILQARILEWVVISFSNAGK